jgi:transcription antitermination factor NusG
VFLVPQVEPFSGRSDSDQTLLSHLHSLLTSSDSQVLPHWRSNIERLRRCSSLIRELQAAIQSKKIEVALGDKVVVVNGDFNGLTGTVSQIEGGHRTHV